ncbi:hypothetical protein [Halobellus rufus]|uniref:hypothetical protein n=1 Tax=Halobellus rufus TaxID=1448860 RepID=UPI0018CF4387|nr:hypothetical protein [Halobellus rufus]
MKSDALPRIVLLVALAGLAGSFAVLVNVSGVISAPPSDTTHEFTIEDGQLIDVRDGTSQPLRTDLSTVERITITDLETTPVVTITPRDPPQLSLAERKRAKQIVTANGTLATPDDAIYTMRPIPVGTRSDRAAIVGADPEMTWSQLETVNETEFTIRDGTPEDTVVLERKDKQMSTQRVLVVVDPLEGNVRYSAIVNLETETVEAFVRLRGVTGESVPN